MAGSSKLSILLVVLTLILFGYLLVVVCIFYSHDTSVADHHNEVSELRSKLVKDGIELITLRSQLTELTAKNAAPAAVTVAAAAVVEPKLGEPEHHTPEGPVGPVQLHTNSPAAPLNNEEALARNRFAQAARKGVVVLGMHRSGTSVTGGLLNRMGLKCGAPLIGPAEDNKKGFFERVDVVLQNDYLLKIQGLHYAAGIHRYDWRKGLRHAEAAIHMRILEDANPDQKAAADRLRQERARAGTNIYSTIKLGVVSSDFFNEGARAMSFFSEAGACSCVCVRACVYDR